MDVKLMMMMMMMMISTRFVVEGVSNVFLTKPVGVNENLGGWEAPEGVKTPWQIEHWWWWWWWWQFPVDSYQSYSAIRMNCFSKFHILVFKRLFISCKKRGWDLLPERGSGRRFDRWTDIHGWNVVSIQSHGYWDWCLVCHRPPLRTTDSPGLPTSYRG